MTEAERMRKALENALEGMVEMLPYVPEYFVWKWELQGYIDRAREALKHDD
jgi:hypothetical protein